MNSYFIIWLNSYGETNIEMLDNADAMHVRLNELKQLDQTTDERATVLHVIKGQELELVARQVHTDWIAQ